MKPLLAAIRATGAVKALAHITGGGLTENMPRVLPDDVAARIDLAALPVPPVFRWLAGLGTIDEAEMLRTFNCGVGMVVVVPRPRPRPSPPALAREGETVVAIGRIEPRRGAAVVYDGTLDLGR